MHRWLARLIIAPLALVLASVGLMAGPAAGITGNFTPDFDHEYVGLIAFYDADGEFVHRCSGTLLSPTVFLTAGHCIDISDAGDGSLIGDSSRIWFEQGAGANYDPVTEHDPVTGYPDSGGITASTFYGFGYAGLYRGKNSTIPNTHDVGLVILDAPVQTVYPDIDTYAQLAPVGTLNTYGTGPTALADQSGYGVSYDRGHGKFVESFRSRLKTTNWITSVSTGQAGGYSVQIAAPRGGTCFGDSGGPTFLAGTDTQVAVTSWGSSPNCTGHSYEFRVDTEAVQSWMESVLTPLGLWEDIAPAA
jgi:hypothetical protein